MFAVQHRGWCAASRTGYRTYGRYGRSNKCRNGKGGPWANDVYFLKGDFQSSNGAHFPTWDVGRKTEKLVNRSPPARDLQTFSGLPTSRVGLLRRETHRKCGVLLLQRKVRGVSRVV